MRQGLSVMTQNHTLAQEKIRSRPNFTHGSLARKLMANSTSMSVGTHLMMLAKRTGKSSLSA